MTPVELQRRAAELFKAALDRDPAGWGEFLAGQCGGDEALRAAVETLLTAHASASGFLEPRWEPAGDMPSSLSAGGLPPDWLAGYEVLKEVHRGGQGVVYEALQKSTRRKVALKVLREGPFATPAEQARFEREVQILAQLNHPCIVAIHDSGQAAGCHYFVMDYVAGQPLDGWIGSGSHSIEETLRLFARICNAVNAAHLRGITHRDLKPGNIRIDESGEPHVLDFGLAKVAHSAAEASLMTLPGQFMGSLPWASPEQAEGVPSKIDIRTDVYSLGVILYQMLTGKFPYEVIGNMRDVLDRIMRAEPIRPSAVGWHGRPGRGINDEVETIVLKCLQKERERRYQSAAELARDIGHYLAGEPIEAKRDSAAYVLRKYLRKHRLPAAVAAGFVVVVTVGLVGSVTFWRQAVVARRHAEERRVAAEAAQAAERRRADELKQVADIQAKQLKGIDVPLMALRLRRGLLDKVRASCEKSQLDEATIAERVDALEKLLAGADLTGLSLALLDENIFAGALQAIDKQFTDQPLIKARLLQTVADMLGQLGLLDAATTPQTEALAIYRAKLGNDHPDTLTSIDKTGVLLRKQGKLAEAESNCRAALEARRRVLGADHPDTLDSVHNMGVLLRFQGKLAEAEAYCREAVESRRRVLGAGHPDTLISIRSLGFLLQWQGKLAEAEPYLREALESSRRVLGNDHPDTLTAIKAMGAQLQLQGKLAESELYHREALESSRRVLGNDHPDTLTAVIAMGVILQLQGKLAEAEPYQREALESSRRVLGNDHRDTLTAINAMGVTLQSQGKLAEAEPYYREALDSARRVLGPDHPETLTYLSNMGALLWQQHKPAEAEPYWREALESTRRVLGPDHPHTLTMLSNMGSLLEMQGRLAEAETYYREALDSTRRSLGNDHPDTLTSINNMGILLKEQGRLSEAEACNREALEGLRRTLGDQHAITLASLCSLGRLLQAQGKPAEAIALLAPEEPAVRCAFTAGAVARLPEFLTVLGRCRTATQAFDMAETNLSEAYTLLIATETPATKRYKLLTALVELYDSWDAAEPGQGHDRQAAEWRARLVEWQASTQPAMTSAPAEQTP